MPTRKFRRSVRLPDGDVGSFRGDATSKSAVSRRFVALSAAKMAEWQASDLSKLDLLAIPIDGLPVTEDLIMADAIYACGTATLHPQYRSSSWVF